MRTLQALLLVPLFLSAGCYTFSSHSHVPDSSGNFVLSEEKEEAGRRVKYDVAPNRDGAPAIHRVSTRILEVAYVGVYSLSIGKKLAQERGLEAWRGVLVERLPKDSPARLAGITAGDVMASIDGTDLTSAEQFKEMVPSTLTPGKPVTVRLLRSDGQGQWSELTLELTPKAKQIDETTTDRIPLEAPSELTRRTGLQIATVPANLSREIWQTDATRALVTSVVSGSPGYRGGIRGGDVVTSCNGQSVNDAQAILAAISAGANEIELEVDGPLGHHRATIHPTKDINDRDRVHIPILIDHTSHVDRSRTSFLDFIFQFGFNHSRTASSSETREANEASRLSILPLGMFEFERSPTKNRTTIFWFITWSTQG